MSDEQKKLNYGMHAISRLVVCGMNDVRMPRYPFGAVTSVKKG